MKAQQGTMSSDNEKRLIPQENCMPIFKPSHKIRILNVNIVYSCVCVHAHVCVCNLIYLRF